MARQSGVAPIPCSSGNRQRHRLHRGGDRQLNHALHIIAVTRAQHDPATREYLARKEAEGKTKKERSGASNGTSRGASTTSSRSPQSPSRPSPIRTTAAQSPRSLLTRRRDNVGTTTTGVAPALMPCVT